MLVRVNLNTNEIKVTYPGNSGLRIAMQDANEFYFHEFSEFPFAISHDNNVMHLSDDTIDESFEKLKGESSWQK